jgi:hypothetical protein
MFWSSSEASTGPRMLEIVSQFMTDDAQRPPRQVRGRHSIFLGPSRSGNPDNAFLNSSESLRQTVVRRYKHIQPCSEMCFSLLEFRTQPAASQCVPTAHRTSPHETPCRHILGFLLPTGCQIVPRQTPSSAHRFCRASCALVPDAHFDACQK